MAAEQSLHAIVLRRRDAGESDRRLTLLTKELGKLDAVAKGARKAGSRLTGMSEPLMLSLIQIASGRSTRFVTQSQPISAFGGLRDDYARLLPALALAELYASVIPYGEPLSDLFTLLVESLHWLEVHPQPVVAVVWAELRLMGESGFLPELTACVDTGAKPKGGAWWLSPMAGGVVSEGAVGGYTDRFRASMESVVGLARTAELSKPPDRLRRSVECLKTLTPFWTAICSGPLPAHDAFLKDLALTERA